MSSSTGIRKRRTPEDRIDEAIDGVADAYLRKARRYSDKALSQGGALGTGPIYGSINPGTNSLQTSGGAMIGSIAFNPSLVAVDDGRINIEPDQNEASKDSSYVLVTGQGSPDDLFFIDGADKNGQYLILQGTLTQILVLKAATISGISNISGLGTVTVDTTSDHNMVTGSKVNIIGTDNFDISDVEVTVITPTQFTYSATGNAVAETAGFAQNGNIVTPDGNDIILDGTQSLNGVPLATLIFDPTVAGFGAWRLVSVSVSTGGITTDASVATLSLSLSQSAGVVDFAFTSESPLGSGITDEGNGVFKLSGGIFQLNSSVLILGTDVSMEAKWQTSPAVDFPGIPTDVGRISLSISINSTTDDNLSNAPITTAFVDATSTDVFVRLLTTDSTNSGIIQTVGTWGQIFSIGGGTNGGGGISFPILYPQDDFGDQGAVVLNVDISGNTGQNKKIRMVGDVGFQFTNPPGSTVLEEIWVTFEQDGTGNHSITTTPTGLKNASNLNLLLDKTANAKTTFHFITEDGGVTFRAELIDLTSGSGDITEPIELGFNEAVVGATTVVQGDVFNPTHISLTQSTTIQLDISATTTKYKSIFVIFDTTGNDFTVTWPASVSNPPIIDDSVAQRISVILYTIDNGTTWTNATSVGSSSSVSQWSTFPAVSDVNLATFDMTNIDRLRFVTNSAGVASNDDPSILLDGNSNMLFNVAEQDEFIWAASNQIIMRLDEDGTNNDTRLTIQTVALDADAVPQILLNRIDPTPENDTDIALIQFQGSNALASGGTVIDPHLYSEIKIEYENVVDGREASSMAFITSFDTGAATSFTPFMGINLGNSGDVDMVRDVGMNLNNIKDVTSIIGRDDGTAFRIIFDGAEDSDTTIQSNIGDPDRIDYLNNAINGWLTFFDSTLSKVGIGIPSGVAAYLSVTDHVIYFDDMSAPADGEIEDEQGAVFFDTSTDPPILKIKKKSSTSVVSTVSLEGAGAAGANTALSNLVSTAVNTNINMGSNFITFDPSTMRIGAAATEILNIEFPTGAEVLRLIWNTSTTPTEDWTFEPNTLNGKNIVLGNTLIINDSSTDPVADGMFSNNGGIMGLFANDFELTNTITGASGTANFVSYRNDATRDDLFELGSIRFDGNNSSDVQTQYAQVLAAIGDVSDFGLLTLRVRANDTGLTTGLTLSGDDGVTDRSYLNVSARINSNLEFGFDGAGSLDARIHPLSASTTLQIVVQDNDNSFTDGEQGMLACPVLASLTPSLSNLDTAFGNHVGAMGVFNTSSANVNVAWKSRSGEWVVIAIPSGSGNVLGEHFN